MSKSVKQVHKKRPTLQDKADLLGVSLATVKRYSKRGILDSELAKLATQAEFERQIVDKVAQTIASNAELEAELERNYLEVSVKATSDYLRLDTALLKPSKVADIALKQQDITAKIIVAMKKKED